MICPNCGKEASGNFCPNCGTALNAKNLSEGTNNSSGFFSESTTPRQPSNYQMHYDAPDQPQSNDLDPKRSTICKSCGTQFSKKAKACPRCGAKNKKPIYKKPWFIILIIVLIIVLFPKGNHTSSDPETNVNSTNRSANTESIQTATTEAIPVISNTVIYEKNSIRMTATRLEKDGNNWNINILIENNSTLNLGIYAHAYAVNGIMTKNSIYDMDCDVAAGKKANAALVIKNSVLEEYGITEIRCVDVLFWAYDNDKSFKEFDTDQIEIKTSLYDNSHDAYNTIKTIYDEKGIKIDYLLNEGNKYYFVIDNSTGNYFNFDFEEITINDYTNSETDYDLYDEIVLNDCLIIVAVTVSDDFKTTNGIEKVTTIEWNLSIRPKGDHFEETKIGPIVLNVE